MYNKVSIISPVYNASEYLAEAIDGMLNQTYKNLEIILVNDGSKDNSLEILNEYAKKDSRIKVLDKENSGAGDSRNQGLAIATGEYVIFLDADDIFYPEMIEKAYNKITQTNADVVFFNYYELDNKTKVKVLKPFMTQYFKRDNVSEFSNQGLKKYSLGITSQTPWNKFYKKSFIEENGLKFSNISSNNDVSFISNAFLVASKISFIEDPLLEYRINTNGSISSGRNKKVFNILKAIKEVENFLTEKEMIKEFADVYFTFAISCILVNLKGASKCTKKEFYLKCQEFLLRDYFKGIIKTLNKQTDLYDYKKLTSYSYFRYNLTNKLRYLYQRRFKNGKIMYKITFLPVLQTSSFNGKKSFKILGIKVK